MTEQLLPDHLTPASREDVYQAMRAAAPELARASVLVLIAQWGLETGFGRAMHANNIGNIKHVAGDGHDFVEFRCDEIVRGVETWFDPPDPATMFRAYASLVDGVQDYISLLRRHFAAAWPCVVVGDPRGFAQELSRLHYYTASEASYERSLCAIFVQLDAAMPRDDVASYAQGALLQAGLAPLDDHDTDPVPPPEG